MTTALAIKDDALPKEQIDLIRRTVANGATNDELALFLYDCQRRGIHPLDKLLHFTKRGGRYTPVTSIDFMRSQAAMTGEMAGSDDPLFENDVDESLRPLTTKPPRSATVTVYRMTQGQRFAYTATARWSEYCPDNAPMWKRMPHTMLGKCAEALALRKAFPQQLAGLYSREEMDQADKGGYVVEAPRAAAPTVLAEAPKGDVLIAGNEHEKDGDPVYESEPTDDLLRIDRIDVIPTSNKNIRKIALVLSDGRQVTTIREQLAALAEQCCQDRTPITVETKSTKWGEDLVALHRVESADVDHSAPLTDDAIPF